MREEQSPFEELVIAESRGQATETAAALLREEKLDEWIETLTSLVVEVDAQFADSKARVAAAKQDSFALNTKEARNHYQAVEAEEADWRRRATHHKTKLIKRLGEAKRLQKQRNLKDSRTREGDHYRTLRNAIMAHRLETEEEYDPTPADVALWDVLDDLTTR